MAIIGLGTEIVEVLRIARMIERRADEFLRHTFTSREIRFCQNRAKSTQFFAAHWAAKQATLKALGIKMREGLRWNDLEIRRISTNEYRAAVRGTMREMIEQTDIGEVLVTLAYCQTHATATVIVLSRE
jgi:holo-[acyl-carrier protein] synthase